MGHVLPDYLAEHLQGELAKAGVAAVADTRLADLRWSLVGSVAVVAPGCRGRCRVWCLLISKVEFPVSTAMTTTIAL